MLPYDFRPPLPKATDLVAEGRVLGFLPTDSVKPGPGPLVMAAGHYELSGLMLFRPVQIPGQEYSPYAKGQSALSLLGLMDRSGSELQVRSEVILNGACIPQGVDPVALRVDRFPPDYLDKIDRFDVRPDQPTEWVIPIPDEMARSAGERAEMFVRLREEWMRSQPQPAPTLPGSQ